VDVHVADINLAPSKSGAWLVLLFLVITYDAVRFAKAPQTKPFKPKITNSRGFPLPPIEFLAASHELLRLRSGAK
jgi:hypothetical protein